MKIGLLQPNGSVLYPPNLDKSHKKCLSVIYNNAIKVLSKLSSMKFSGFEKNERVMDPENRKVLFRELTARMRKASGQGKFHDMLCHREK